MEWDLGTSIRFGYGLVIGFHWFDTSDVDWVDIPCVRVLYDETLIDIFEEPVGYVLLLEVTPDVCEVVEEKLVVVLWVFVFVGLYFVDHVSTFSAV